MGDDSVVAKAAIHGWVAPEVCIVPGLGIVPRLLVNPEEGNDEGWEMREEGREMRVERGAMSRDERWEELMRQINVIDICKYNGRVCYM